LRWPALPFKRYCANPLADPYILGVSGGAALGSILGIMFAGQLIYGRPLMSFAGAATASFVVYRLGRRDDDPARLVLAGVVISTFLSSVIALVISLAEDVKLRNITLWLLGDLSSGTIEGLVFVLLAAVVGWLFSSRRRALST
jgi:iron complex transport system permease protein